MKKLILLLLMLVPSAWAASYTEFYVQTDGNNLNSGSSNTATAQFTGLTGYFTNTTGWWKATGAVDLSGVAVGMWASIITNASTTNRFVALVTNVSDVNDTIAVSLLAKGGTVPSSDTAGFTEIRVGGAWQGPNTNIAYTAASDPRMMHPFGFVSGSMTNTPSVAMTRVNFKAGTYTFTNAITSSGIGPIWFCGYTSTPNDGGRATLLADNAVGFDALTISGDYNRLDSFQITANATSGNGHGVTFSSGGQYSLLRRCVVNGFRVRGINLSGAAHAVECEVYSTGANDGNTAGIYLNTSGAQALRCNSHDNQANGFIAAGSSGCAIIDCLSYNNASSGIAMSTESFIVLLGNNVYSNASDGISGAIGYVENNNVFRNGGNGFVQSSPTDSQMFIINNAVGQGEGTQTNVLGNFQYPTDHNTLLYGAALTPWVDPTNGNFTPIAGSAGLAAGRSLFLHSTVNSPTNTVSFRDLGATQLASTNTGSSTTIRRVIFSQ